MDLFLASMLNAFQPMWPDKWLKVQAASPEYKI